MLEDDDAIYHYFKDFPHNVLKNDGDWCCLEVPRDTKNSKVFKYVFTDINKMLAFMYTNYMKFNKKRAELKKLEDESES